MSDINIKIRVNLLGALVNTGCDGGDNDGVGVVTANAVDGGGATSGTFDGKVAEFVIRDVLWQKRLSAKFFLEERHLDKGVHRVRVSSQPLEVRFAKVGGAGVYIGPHLLDPGATRVAGGAARAGQLAPIICALIHRIDKALHARVVLSPEAHDTFQTTQRRGTDAALLHGWNE